VRFKLSKSRVERKLWVSLRKEHILTPDVGCNIEDTQAVLKGGTLDFTLKKRGIGTWGLAAGRQHN